MILPNHSRLRLALKIVLAVTLPLWILPLMAAVLFGLIGCMFWDAVSDIVDGLPPSRGRGGGR